jgi:hypothetical protein
MAEAKPAVAPEPPYIALVEAAQLTGKHPEALRAMARRGRLRSKRGNDGRWLVQIPATLMADRKPGDDRDLAGQVADLETLVGELRDALFEAKLKIARLEADAEAGQRAAAAELAAERAVGEELRKSLDWHRQAWWKRWWG